MKKLVYTFLLLFVAIVGTLAQTTILDFETPATSTSFQYFGSSLDGSLNQIVNNPNSTGLNTSDKVAMFIKPTGAEVWAGAFSNPKPSTAVDLIANTKVSLLVHMDHVGSVSLKLEASSNGGDNWLLTVPNTKINEWEEIVFDVSLPSLEAPFTAAAGHIYTNVVLFFDFGTVSAATNTISFFDKMVALPNAASVTKILDFESAGTNTNFQYFGSALDGTLTTVIANPNATGINTSANVLRYVKPAVSEVWAGAFSNPNPTTLVDFSNGGQICANVHMDHIGSLSIKLEGSTSGKPNWILKVPNTKVNEWETLCFDSSLPSIEAPFEAASGAYERIVIFYDFGTAGTGTEVISYLDDIVVKASTAPQIRTVNFAVDMNNYTPNFNKVYASGTFNNWSGDANELTDPNSDGIYTGTIAVPNGSYEYKITLDNWNVQEAFIGTEECIKRDPTGQFVNRLLLVSADTDVPKFCFNSCYACGEELRITFKLGMNGVTPNPEGVWIAGGGNFSVPGGNFKMTDANGDQIYELVVPRRAGFNSYFTFTNGPCADYSCKENLAGLPCGVATNFNDRFLPAITKDTIVATCFGTCFDNAQCVVGTSNLVSDATLFQMYGNPVSEATSLYFGSEISSAKRIEITNTLGQVVLSREVSAGQQVYQLPISELNTGIHFVTVRAENRYFTRKFIR
jgi:hypothetical protein